jgi:hypothetical protein
LEITGAGNCSAEIQEEVPAVAGAAALLKNCKSICLLMKSVQVALQMQVLRKAMQQLRVWIILIMLPRHVQVRSKAPLAIKMI